MIKKISDPPLIRQMVNSDLDRIVEIDLKMLGKLRREYWEMKLEMSEKQSNVSSLVADLDGNVVGFIFGGVSGGEYGMPENIGWVDSIGVDYNFQRMGIARILFTELSKNLKQAGVNTIRTFVTRRDWRLLKFFNSMGFQEGDMVNLEVDI